MTRLLEVLYALLKEKGFTREEFSQELVAQGYGDAAEVESMMDGKIDPCVSIVKAAREILALTADEAGRMRAAGIEDGDQAISSLQRV